MKSVICYLCLFLSVSGFANGTEEEEISELTSCDKTYVDPHQVHFFDKSIFINFQNLWVQTSAVQSDANGLYFDSFYPDEGRYSWRCSNPQCRKFNEGYLKFCSKCGRAKP